jgi:hypothetical protein
MFDALDADTDEGADLEELSADGAAAGLGQVGSLQGDERRAGKAARTGKQGNRAKK